MKWWWVIPAVIAASGASASEVRNLRGQILGESGGRCIIRFENGGGAKVSFAKGVEPPPPGDVIEASGDLAYHQLRGTTYTKVASRPLPEPVTASPGAVARGECDFRRVCVNGVLFSAEKDEFSPDWLWLRLRSAEGCVHIAAKRGIMPDADWERLVDAEIAVTMIAEPLGSSHRILGSGGFLHERGQLEILKSAPADIFSGRDIPPTGDVGFHRFSCRGKVVAVGRSRFFLKVDERERILTLETGQGTQLPKAGEYIEVAAFPMLDPLVIKGVMARTRPCKATHDHESAVEEEAKWLTIGSLFMGKDGRRRINTESRNRYVRMEGLVEDSGGEELVLSEGKDRVYVDVSGLRDANAELPATGARAAVSGVLTCEFEYKDDIEGFPPFRRFVLTPGNAADITVTAKPPWWTYRRVWSLVALLVFAVFSVVTWNLTLKRTAKRLAKQLAASELQESLTQLKVEERTRLSVELHDSISQTLTGVSMQLEALSRKGFEDADAGRRLLAMARQLLARCRHDLRTCIWDLRTHLFEDHDMTAAIARVLSNQPEGVKIKVRFNVERKVLSESAVHAVLTIVRELASNAVRHGRARRIDVAGELRYGTVRFSVRDDGTGFDPATAVGPAEGHFGLQGIRERLAGFNGALQIESTPGGGTRAVATLKIEEWKS